MFARPTVSLPLLIPLAYLEACWVLESEAAPMELGAARRHALAGARRRTEVAIGAQKRVLMTGEWKVDVHAEGCGVYIVRQEGIVNVQDSRRDVEA